uniref:Pollen coat protein B25 n=1 Tax=Brassica oleracea TaxID=3712 RepID=A0A4Y6I0Q7_BRAOL|nr:pollen coat protein B25 [Brassica oleracea]
MSSSKLAIFCIIMITLLPFHEFVDGQGLKARNAPPRYCQERNFCDALTVICYVCNTGIYKKRVYTSKKICTEVCKP